MYQYIVVVFNTFRASENLDGLWGYDIFLRILEHRKFGIILSDVYLLIVRSVSKNQIPRLPASRKIFLWHLCRENSREGGPEPAPPPLGVGEPPPRWSLSPRSLMCLSGKSCGFQKENEEVGE